MTVGGFVVGFMYGWKLALVCIATVPFIGVSGYLFFKVLNKTLNEKQASF